MPQTPPGNTAIHLLAIPVLSDNYVWLLHNGCDALVCDPGQAEPVIAFLQKNGLRLADILITHHHADHTAGISRLYRQCATPQTQVYLPKQETLAAETLAGVPQTVLRHCRENNTLNSLELRVRVLDVPGHTAGHIAYFVDKQADMDAPIVLCGDALFSAGCGRLFEGTPAQMHASLQKLAALPDTTQVCCAHEFTQSNLRFAQTVEPDNVAIQEHAQRCETLRKQGLPSLPTTLALEKAINPFLRLHAPAVQQSALHFLQQSSQQSHTAALNRHLTPEQLFAALRAWKDAF